MITLSSQFFSPNSSRTFVFVSSALDKQICYKHSKTFLSTFSFKSFQNFALAAFHQINLIYYSDHLYISYLSVVYKKLLISSTIFVLILFRFLKAYKTIKGDTLLLLLVYEIIWKNCHQNSLPNLSFGSILIFI